MIVLTAYDLANVAFIVWPSKSTYCYQTVFRTEFLFPKQQQFYLRGATTYFQG